jgi:hypothetical protein
MYVSNTRVDRNTLKSIGYISISKNYLFCIDFDPLDQIFRKNSKFHKKCIAHL